MELKRANGVESHIKVTRFNRTFMELKLISDNIGNALRRFNRTFMELKHDLKLSDDDLFEL